MNSKLLNVVPLDTDIVIKKGTGVMGDGVVIKNQSKTVRVTENGVVSVTPDGGYTGLGVVTADVDVPLLLQEKTVAITSKSTTETFTPDDGYNGLKKITVDVDVPFKFQDKEVENAASARYTPDSSYDGFSKLTVRQKISTEYTGFEVEVVEDNDVRERLLLAVPFGIAWQDLVNDHASQEGLDRFCAGVLGDEVAYIDDDGSAIPLDADLADKVDSSRYVVIYPSSYKSDIGRVSYHAEPKTLWKDWVNSAYNNGGFTIDENDYVKSEDGYLLQTNPKDRTTKSYVTSDMVFCHNGLYSFTSSAPAGYVSKEVAGNDELIISDMEKDSIASLELSGGCVQNDVPSPLAPIDITTSKGVFKSVWRGIPRGFKRLIGVRMNADTYFTIAGFYLTGQDTLRVSFEADKACNLIGCYTTAEADNNYDIYLSTTNGSKYLRYNGGAYLSSVEVNKRYDVVVTPTGATGFDSPSTWDTKDFRCSTEMLVGTTSVDATSSKFSGVIYGDVIVDGRLWLVPCERVSDGVIGYYDRMSGEFFEPTVGVPLSAGYDLPELKMYYTLSDSLKVHGDDDQDILIPVALHGIGDIKDTYDLVTGIVTRRIGYKIFDGSEESWYLSMSGDLYRYRYKFTEEDNAKFINGRGTDMMSTHFKVLASGSSENGAFLNGSSNAEYLFLIPQQTITTLEDFKEFLATQYAAGTPVIVFYSLENEITENVDPVEIKNSKGENTFVRKAGIADMGMKVTCNVKSDEPEASKKITFIVIAGSEEMLFEADEGMTWGEYVASSYNTDGQFVASNGAIGFVAPNGVTRGLLHWTGANSGKSAMESDILYDGDYYNVR